MSASLTHPPTTHAPSTITTRTRFSLNSSKHGVDARTLALAFGPLILRSTSSSSRELLLLNVASAVKLCQRLILTPELTGL